MKTITVKLLNPALNILIALITFFVLLLLFNLILSRYLPAAIYHGLSFILAVISSIFLAKYLSKGQGKIHIDDDHVLITIYNEYLNKDYYYSIERSEVIAFEITQNKYFQKLVFYKDKKKPLMFTLLTDKEQEKKLIDFFKGNFRHLDKKERLSSVTFLSAFGLSFLSLLIIVTGILTVYISINCWNYFVNETFIKYPPLSWLLLTVVFLFLYNSLHYRRNFKIVGRDFTWFILIFSTFIIFLTLIPASYCFFQKPKKVYDLTENTSDYKHKFFTSENILIDTTQIGYIYKVSTPQKSRFHTFTHFFTVPIISTDNPTEIDHHLWIGGKYSQQIRKGLSHEEKNKYRIDFLNEKANVFKKEVVMHTEFYEVIHHQNNKAFKSTNFMRSALSTGHIKQPLIILRAHEESFEDFQNSMREKILTGVLITITVLLLNALVIAFNR